MRTTEDAPGHDGMLINRNDPILISGGAGLIGSRVVENLLARGFRNLRCLARPSTGVSRAELAGQRGGTSRVQVIRGNLLSRDDCAAAVKDVAVILHLAAARGEKSFPDAFMNSVVTTRNLVEAALQEKSLRRFVNVSSFAVYTNSDKPRGRLLDESCPVEQRPDRRGHAYTFAKAKQDDLVTTYGDQFRLPY